MLKLVTILSPHPHARCKTLIFGRTRNRRFWPLLATLNVRPENLNSCLPSDASKVILGSIVDRSPSDEASVRPFAYYVLLL